MKTLYLSNIKNAFTSKEYWLGFAIILFSCILTSTYNLSPSGIFGNNKIGSSEFFIAATMYSNTLLQISAPIIAIFVCMNRNSIFMRDLKDINNIWKYKKIRVHLMSTITIAGSVFLLSFLLLVLAGVILFQSPSGSMHIEIGLFKELYKTSPFEYVFVYILHSVICSVIFALFGLSLKVLIVKPVNLVLFIPLLYYSCFERIGFLFPIGDAISFISPFFTFDITVYEVPPLKRFAELAFVLAISIVLLIISFYKNKKLDKLEHDNISIP